MRCGLAASRRAGGRLAKAGDKRLPAEVLSSASAAGSLGALSGRRTRSCSGRAVVAALDGPPALATGGVADVGRGARGRISLRLWPLAARAAGGFVGGGTRVSGAATGLAFGGSAGLGGGPDGRCWGRGRWQTWQ